jgi:hypothetical protein
VYYGYTLYENSQRYAREIFRVPLSDLKAQFGAYKKFDGIAALKLIGAVLSSHRPEHGRTMLQDFPWKAELLENKIIRLYVDWSYSLDGGPVTRQPFRMDVSARDGSLKTVTFIK